MKDFMSEMEFISIGDILIDFIAEDKSELSNVTSFKKCFGGAPGNYAVAISRLGGKAGLISLVGDDPFGDFLINTLNEENIDNSSVFRTNTKTTLAFVNSRSEFIFYRGSDINLNKKHVNEDYIKKGRFLHYSGFTLSSPKPFNAIKYALSFAKKHGLITSLSVNYRPDAWTKTRALAAYKKCLPLTDIVIASEEEATLLGGTQFLRQNLENIASLGAKQIVITRGSKGCYVFDDDLVSLPPYKVTAVDATGAGDSFCAALMFSLSKDKSLEEAASFANAVGALATTKKGAINALPTQKEVKAFLKENKPKGRKKIIKKYVNVSIK